MGKFEKMLSISAKFAEKKQKKCFTDCVVETKRYPKLKKTEPRFLIKL